jgi:hypothetical protein
MSGATVRYSFNVGRDGARKILRAGPASAPVPQGRIPRVARLLALAHKFQKMLDSGEVESMAELARLGRVSRARITQIMDLLMLAPEIQEEVLFGRKEVALRDLMPVVRDIRWANQAQRWRSVRCA